MNEERWLPELPDNLRVGTSSFSWAEWHGVFYPRELRTADRLGDYALKFPTVEIDSTFYAVPSRQSVSGWALKTPEDFCFALKVPQAITHEARLRGVDALTAQFLETVELLGPRRGPLLLQFPYVPKSVSPEEYEYGDDFIERLRDWLTTWSGAAPWVVEVRNANWVNRRLLALLAEHEVPLAFTAYYTMPSLARLLERDLDPVTGKFAYVRFIGDRKKIEARMAQAEPDPEQRKFDRLYWDRERELRAWVDALLPIVARMRTYVYFNNHYAGFGPGSASLFAQLWREIHDLD